MVAIACNVQLYEVEVEEETMDADTNDNIIRRENYANDINIASLRRWSATSLQTAVSALES